MRGAIGHVRFTPESGHKTGKTSMTRKEWRKRAVLLPENDHRKDRGAARQPITVASMTLARPTLRHAPSDHWQAYGIT